MSAELLLQPSPEQAALAAKREQLAATRTRLADAEADLAQLRAELRAFEGRYLREVATLYAQLDDLEARLAEHQAARHPADPAAQARAAEARQRATESHDAAFGEAHAAEPFPPPPNLKALFRELAKRIHPDFARDDAEAAYLHLLMARANSAYNRGDAALLQRLLDDHRELTAADLGETAAAESLRLSRQIRHAERDLARLEAERHALLGGELAQLFAESEAAAADHRDLLAELAAGLRRDLLTAEQRLASLIHPVPSHAG